MRWDPAIYARYADERSRPFFDLVAQIDAPAPVTVVDLGCGAGELTASLAQRWPAATVTGLDSSAEMIDQAQADAGVEFRVAAAEDFTATGVDVLVTNAALQWVPTHRDLLATWADQLNPGGWLAMQVPANFDAPSHRLMRELAASPDWQAKLAGVLRGADSVATPAEYLTLLSSRGLTVNVWQTEYLHVLQGVDPVLGWVGGTGLRPVLGALSPADGAAFSAEYAALLRNAYPESAVGTIFPFLRTFVVAHKPITAAA